MRSLRRSFRKSDVRPLLSRRPSRDLIVMRRRRRRLPFMFMFILTARRARSNAHRTPHVNGTCNNVMLRRRRRFRRRRKTNSGTRRRRRLLLATVTFTFCAVTDYGTTEVDDVPVKMSWRQPKVTSLSACVPQSSPPPPGDASQERMRHTAAAR